MTNVLIPTDFTVQSLDLVSKAALRLPGKLSIFLFHTFDMPDNLIDAMHMNGIKNHNNLITEELRLKCRQLKADHANISSVCFRLIFGTTVAVFKNFAEANDIDLIIYPTGYKHVSVVRESVNPERMFLKSGVKVIRDLSAINNAPRKQVALPVFEPGNKSSLAVHGAH